jgi:hypothetical protein
MSETEGPPADRRHPHWCDWQRCEASNPKTFGDHRSAIVPVERVKPYDARPVVWLSQHIYEPPDESEVWVNLRIESAGSNGELDSLYTDQFRLSQAAQLGGVLHALAKRGEDRTLVDEQAWRKPLPAPPVHGNPGNSGPGYYSGDRP